MFAAIHTQEQVEYIDRLQSARTSAARPTATRPPRGAALLHAAGGLISRCMSMIPRESLFKFRDSMPAGKVTEGETSIPAIRLKNDGLAGLISPLAPAIPGLA